MAAKRAISGFFIGWDYGTIRLNPSILITRPVSLFSQFASGLARPLDRFRLGLLRRSGLLGRRLVRRRDQRVLAGGILLVGISLGLTLAVPFWLLALSPLVWGIPHVMSDFRYLVLRPGLHRRIGLCLGAGLPLVAAGSGFFSVQSGLVAAAAAALLARGRWSRKLAVLAVCCFLFRASWNAGALAGLVFAHVHNFLALILWWWWRPRTQGWLSVLFPFGFVMAAAGLWFGWLAPLSEVADWIPDGLGLDYHLGILAPGLESPWGLRLVLLFAFAQAVHYGIWLRLIPEDDRPQPSPRTFAASFRALEKDFGPRLLWFSLLLMTGLAIWAMVDLLEARVSYLRMALFHGYLELAAVALLVVEGRPYLPVGEGVQG